MDNETKLSDTSVVSPTLYSSSLRIRNQDNGLTCIKPSLTKIFWILTVCFVCLSRFSIYKGLEGRGGPLGVDGPW